MRERDQKKKKFKKSHISSPVDGMMLKELENLPLAFISATDFKARCYTGYSYSMLQFSFCEAGLILARMLFGLTMAVF